MNNYILETQRLRKNFKNGAHRLEVLKGIDLAIKENEFVAIQGPSGAGKSTLLHILGGLDFPSKGEVWFKGNDLYRLSENERANLRNSQIGFVFQFYHLLPELTVLENALLPALLKSWWERRKSTGYARALLDKLGLSARINYRPNRLSGGEQQRLAIVRALMNRPQLLLCDEPTGNLDSENGQNILSLLKQLNDNERMTVILVTHDKDIAKVSERIIYLKDGLILN